MDGEPQVEFGDKGVRYSFDVENNQDVFAYVMLRVVGGDVFRGTSASLSISRLSEFMDILKDKDRLQVEIENTKDVGKVMSKWDENIVVPMDKIIDASWQRLNTEKSIVFKSTDENGNQKLLSILRSEEGNLKVQIEGLCS